jgi:hypothetical protein
MSVVAIPSPPTITLARLVELARRSESPAVSIHLPIDRRHPDNRHEHDTLDRLLDRARHLLHDPHNDAERVLAPVLEALDRRVICEHGEGLAFFLGPGSSAEVAVGLRLEPLLVVADRFQVAQLLPSVDRSIGGHVLSLDVDHVRLQHIGGAALHECQVPDLPRSVDEALWFERTERHSGSHSEGFSGRGAVMRRSHGSGAQQEDRKARIERFLHLVDHAVLHHVGDDRSHPLVVAGTGPVVSRYRTLSRHPWTVALEVGSPVRLPDDQLRRRVAEAVASPDGIDELLERLGARLGTGLASTDPVEIVVAASQGAVAALLVGSVDPWWAAWPSTTDRLEASGDGAVDLINLAVSDALRSNATVHLVPAERLPAGPLAAILRY